MGQVVFLNTNYKPSEAEKIQFYFLQASMNNVVKEIYDQERDKDWAKIRVDQLIHARRSKLKLVKCEKSTL